MLVYLCSVLRARGKSFLVLVYNVAAKEELLSRGLRPHEVYNFHSYLFRQYIQVIRATLTENSIMMQEHPSHSYPNPKPNPIVLALTISLTPILNSLLP